MNAGGGQQPAPAPNAAAAQPATAPAPGAPTGHGVAALQSMQPGATMQASKYTYCSWLVLSSEFNS